MQITSSNFEQNSIQLSNFTLVQLSPISFMFIQLKLMSYNVKWIPFKKKKIHKNIFVRRERKKRKYKINFTFKQEEEHKYSTYKDSNKKKLFTDSNNSKAPLSNTKRYYKKAILHGTSVGIKTLFIVPINFLSSPLSIILTLL